MRLGSQCGIIMECGDLAEVGPPGRASPSEGIDAGRLDLLVTRVNWPQLHMTFALSVSTLCCGPVWEQALCLDLTVQP